MTFYSGRVLYRFTYFRWKLFGTFNHHTKYSLDWR